VVDVFVFVFDYAECFLVAGFLAADVLATALGAASLAAAPGRSPLDGKPCVAGGFGTTGDFTVGRAHFASHSSPVHWTAPLITSQGPSFAGSCIALAHAASSQVPRYTLK
jgi:hypothetical protein